MGAEGSTARFLLVVLVGCLASRTAYGLECFRCVSTNSTRPFLCNEFLSHSEDLEPESCDDVYNAQYCIKHVGRFEGGVGTKRFCSSVDLGNYCDYVQQPGDKLSYRTCVYTCNSDGCNPASSLTPSRCLSGLLCIISFGYLYGDR
ncbi:U-scoloptoxin(05)-Sm1a isoform X2 [Phymastichus coffea]|uniref:U-scoloptoxin(05)-Sm1a isoform X2 n=1 Tax=Phymastichus coffea TaxID=108790 RepID=UPI00273B6523|nr:U-scoloptoxin(05)-Sm1a isoform X2 [Phymastichus coffea]